MLSHIVRSHAGLVEDAGIQHYRATHLRAASGPPMPVFADDIQLSQGSLNVHVHPRALRVVAGTVLTGQDATPAKIYPKLAPDE